MTKSIRIMLVDDEPEFVGAMASFLRAKGYVVEGVHRAKDGLEKVRAGGFDIIFIDFNMPEMNGLQLLEAIRGFSTELPVVMITGFVQDVEADRASALGISAIFSKTSSFRELDSIIQAVLPAGGETTGTR